MSARASVGARSSLDVRARYVSCNEGAIGDGVRVDSRSILRFE